MSGASEPRRLEITPGMRRFLDYPKFRGTTRVLILETGYFFDKSWVRAARELGWEVATVPSAMVGDLSRDAIAQLFTALGSFKPDFLLTSNYAGMDPMGLFARFLEDARVPYVSWFTDTPRMLLFNRDLFIGHYTVAATWERAYIPHLRAFGFQHVHFMPHATDSAVFDGTWSRRPARALSFVGTSMVEQAQEAYEKQLHHPDLIEAVMAAVAAGKVVRENYVYGPAAMLEAERLEGLTEGELRNVELFLNYEATRQARSQLAQALDPLGLEVRGDSGWRNQVGRAHGPVNYFEDLAAYYQSTAINVNHTAIQMPAAVNQRVFDCPAAGGFLITDKQADLEEHFEPDREMVCYKDVDELAEKVRYYRDRPGICERMVYAAQQRIGREHLHRHRLERLRDMLVSLYADDV